MTELEEARRKIAELQAECEQLRERLRFLEYSPTLAAGFQGETLVSKMVNGQMTVFTAASDIVIEASGLTLEVKFSNLNDAVVSKKAATKRWTWSRPLGHGNKKVFDRLILVGVSDVRYQQHYVEKGIPYVFFDVPFVEIEPLTIPSGTHRNIQISTNPLTARTPQARSLFDQYQVSYEDLCVRYGLGKPLP